MGMAWRDLGKSLLHSAVYDAARYVVFLGVGSVLAASAYLLHKFLPAHDVWAASILLVLSSLVVWWVTRRLSTPVSNNQTENESPKSVLEVPASLRDRIFAVCAELSKYVADRDERPDENKLWNETASKGNKELFVSRYNNEIQSWDDKLAAGYWLWFRDRLVNLRHELTLCDRKEEQLVIAMSELDINPTQSYKKALTTTIERFRYLAATLDG